MLSDDGFKKVLQYFDRSWPGYRKVRKGVKKRIRRHMNKLGCHNTNDYLKILARNPVERTACEICLLVTISRFFRDPSLWRHLKNNILPELISLFPDGIRIWSAGCACGEEVYSLSILLDNISASASARITATDINPLCLERAKIGIYKQSSLKEMSEKDKTRYFEKQKSGREFAVIPDLKKTIHWQQKNLFGSPPKGLFHMIFLRNNLLTYFKGLQQKDAFENILSSLATNGFLVKGSHENLPADYPDLVQDSLCPWIYQKR